MGIIGKTHGVNKAANPLKKAMKNNLQILKLLFPFSFPGILNEKSTASGGKH